MTKRDGTTGRGCEKTVTLAKNLPQRLKAAKQSKEPTAALKRCASPKPRHPKAAPPQSCASPKPRHPKAAPPQSRYRMEFFRNV
jgi:hypothetical protein